MTFRRISLPQAIFALVVGVSLPLIMLSTLLMQQLINAERNAVSGGHIAAARTLAALVENEVETHTAIATSISASQSLRDGDLAAFHREASAIVQRMPATWIVMADNQGRTILSTRQAFGEPLDPREMTLDTVRRPSDLKTPDVSDLVRDERTGELITMLIYPVVDGGSTRFTIMVSMPPSEFLKLIENKFGSDAAVAILDRQRRFIARIPDHTNRLGSLAAESWRQAIASSPVEGTVESVTLEGVKSLTSYTATRFGWTAGLSYPLDTLYAPVRRQIWAMGIIGALLLAIAMLIATLLSQQIAAEIRAVSRDAQTLAEGEGVSCRKLRIEEAQVLNAALSDASATLRQRLEELTSARVHQQFLLRELAHRLKNQLTVVNSMVRQTARGAATATELADKLTDRTQGLAIGVDLLVNQSWQTAPLDQLIRRQLEPFCPSPLRLIMGGPEVLLNADLTQSIGLAIHELATNVVKYGAWSNDVGIVRVEWSVRIDEGAKALNVVWQETGGPVVSPPQRRGFGQVVIAQAAGRFDGASSKIEFAPQGLIWTLTTRIDQAEAFPRRPATGA